MPLINYTTFNASQVIFSDPKKSTIPGTSRIVISTSNTNQDRPTPLVLATDKLWCFGVKENFSLDKVTLTGYQMALSLFDRDQPTDMQEQFVNALETIVEATKAHLLRPEIKKEIGKRDLIEGDLRKLNPIWKKLTDEGDVIDEKSGVLYAKLKCNKELDITTAIADPQGNRLTSDQIKEMVAGFHAQCAIQIESIHIGTKCSLQLKIIECIAYPRQQEGFMLIRQVEQEEEESDKETEPEEHVSLFAPPPVVSKPPVKAPKTTRKPLAKLPSLPSF